MKNIKSFILIVAASLLLAACSDPGREETKDLTIENFPSIQEISAMAEEDREDLRRQAKDIPLDSCEDYFFEAIDTLLSTKTDVKLDSVKITEDKLSLVEGRNKRSLRDLYVEIDLRFEDVLAPHSLSVQQETAQEIVDALIQYSYFTLNVRSATLYAVQENAGRLEILGYSGTELEETIFAEQPEDEYAVQTLLFDHAAQKDGLTLTKFGNVAEEQELYIEYSLSSDKADMSEDGLESLSEEVKAMLLSHEESTAYIAEHGIKKITVSFYSPQLKDRYIKHSFDL